MIQRKLFLNLEIKEARDWTDYLKSKEISKKIYYSNIAFRREANKRVLRMREQPK